jgi:hypothetical protein
VRNLAFRHFIRDFHLGSFERSLKVLSRRAASSHATTKSKLVWVQGFWRIKSSSNSADS